MRNDDIPYKRGGGGSRKGRDRQGTEARLLEAARTILRRDGVLAGLRLQEVADVAGVNRGQIYQYFGDRQGFLRAAIVSIIESKLGHTDRHWKLPFVERRIAMFKVALEQPELVLYEALLALDGDDDINVFPHLEDTKSALRKDIEHGTLPEDSDVIVAHVMTAAAYMGYVLFRHLFVNSTGIDVKSLDDRALVAYEKMTRGLTVSDT